MNWACALSTASVIRPGSSFWHHEANFLNVIAERQTLILRAFASRWKYQETIYTSISGRRYGKPESTGWYVSLSLQLLWFQYSDIHSFLQSYGTLAPLLRFVSKTQVMICARQKDRSSPVGVLDLWPSTTRLSVYRISRPIRRTFFPEKCDLNSTCVLCAEGIIFKLINTRTSIIQHLYREIVKTTTKMTLVAVVTTFCVSMMNKLYYGC